MHNQVTNKIETDTIDRMDEMRCKIIFEELQFLNNIYMDELNEDYFKNYDTHVMDEVQLRR